MILLIFVTSCGGSREVIRTVIEYRQTECHAPDPPIEPVYFPIEMNFYDTEAGRLYCENRDNAVREGANIKMIQNAFRECQQILLDMKKEK